jgi:superfamily II DNA or RNA helicase
VRIHLSNHAARVPGASKAEYAWLQDYLVIKTARFVYDRWLGRSKYDGEDTVHLFDLETESFPSGFVPQVVRLGRERGFDVELVDDRVRPAERDPGADLRWLRDYQMRCLEACFRRTRGLVEGATGMGKTDLIVGLTRALPTAKFLVLVHRSNLMRDIKKRILRRAGEHGLPEPTDVGLYGDGSKELDRRITIATFQTLSANKNNPAVKAMLGAAQAVIVDEAHTAAAGTFAAVIEKCPNAYYRWGVSGTPLDRSDKRSNITIGLLGPIICRVPATELIEAGVLAKPLVRFMRYDAEEVYAAKWSDARVLGLVENRARNQAVLHATKRAAKPCLLFVDILDHGKDLAERLARAKINAEFVWGDKKTKERQAALDRLERGDLDVVVSSPVFNEGIDVPDLRSVVMAAGGQSVIATLQRIGRGMRKTPTKDVFEVWDFEDLHHRMLENHFNARRAAYKRQGHEMVIDTSVLSLKAPAPVRRLVKSAPAPA